MEILLYCTRNSPFVGIFSDFISYIYYETLELFWQSVERSTLADTQCDRILDETNGTVQLLGDRLWLRQKQIKCRYRFQAADDYRIRVRIRQMVFDLIRQCQKNRRLFRLCPAILFSFSVRLLPSGIDPVLLPVQHQRNGSGQRVQQAGRRSEARLRPVLQGSEHLLLPDRLQLDRGPMW